MGDPVLERRLQHAVVESEAGASEAALVSEEQCHASRLTIFVHEGIGWQIVSRAATYQEAHGAAQLLRASGVRVLVLLHSPALKNGCVVLERDAIESERPER